MMRKATWLLNGLLVLLTLVYVLFFLWAAWVRVRYPFELEWVEGGFLLELEHLLSGKALYTAPNLTYVPFIYPPLYFHIAALVTSLVGRGFTALRLVSLASTLITWVLLALWVWRETRRVLPALVAVGFYAGTYPLSGTWFDVGRVDALFLMWAVLAAMLLRFSSGWTGGALAGVALTLAFLTKQTGLTLAVPMLIYAFFSSRPASRAFLVTFIFLASLSVLVLSLTTQGWFVYYAFYLPGHFHLLPSKLWRFWKVNMLAYVGMALLAYLVFLLWEGVERQWDRGGLYTALFVGWVGSAWMSWSHLGGYQNDLMPAHALLAVGLGLFLAKGRTRFDDVSLRLAVPLLVLLQLFTLVYSPRAVMPRPRDAAAGNELILHLSEVKGGVYVPFHPYLAERAGKGVTAHVAAVADVVRGDPAGWGARLRESIRQTIRQRKYEVILLDTPGRVFLDEDTEQLVRDYYRGPFRALKGDVFFPVAGWRTRPERLYRR